MEYKQEKEYIFRSKLPDIEIPNHLPIHTYCFQNVSAHRSRPALIHASTGSIFTHADVELTARRIAVGFHRIGIRKGDVVMLLLHNSPEFAFALLAASFIGATITTANPLYTAEEVAYQARISDPKLVVTHACYVEKLNRFYTARIATIDSPQSRTPNLIRFSELAESDEKLLPDIEIDAEDTATMLFSSGTTGLPKGAMLSHKNIVTCISQQIDGENPTVYTEPQDVTVLLLPMFHCYSLTTLLCNLRAGAGVVIMPRFELSEMMEMIQKYRVTIAPLVPPILLAIAKSPAASTKYDLSSVRRVVCGAAPMDKQLEDSVKVKLPNAVIAQGYGMTEAGLLATCLGFAKRPFKFKSGACGTVLPNSRMKVVDPVTGASLPHNMVGEFCIKGDSVMKGYYKDPEATKRTITPDGWLHTGDIGYVDDNDELFIVDRLKELIKYKGFHIAPAELEALLVSHPAVSEAGVVPMKDEYAGEVPVAFVVRQKGPNISEQEIKQYISSKVAPYKRIHRVFFIDELPKNPSGKILRKNLRSKI